MIAEYYDENMIPIDTNNLITTHLDIPSVPFTNRWRGGDEGINPIYTGSDIQQKRITATIGLLAYDYLDYQLLRDTLYHKFGFGKPLYIVDKRYPAKRHKVILESSFMPEKLNYKTGTATVPFITSKLPFAESVGTTKDIEENFDYRVWPEGMGLIPDNESYIYTHESDKFRIYNAGISIHPFEQDLTITINNIQNSEEYLELENTTNGTVFRVNEPVTDKQEIKLDGAVITSNGLQFTRSTNKQFIELTHGWNDFIVRGATSARVSFNFRFYYH